MKKYALIITCLTMLTGALVAQPDSSSGSSSSGSSGQSSGTSSGGTGGSLTEPSGAATSSSSSSTNTIAEPSGASSISQTPGVITLQGTVNSSTEKQEIERQLRQVSGVTDVRNMLKVSGSGSGSSSQPQSGTSNPSNP